MSIYITADDNWFAIYSAASGDLQARFSTRQDATDYAIRQGWIIVEVA